jgi:hypothetical protein
MDMGGNTTWIGRVLKQGSLLGSESSLTDRLASEIASLGARLRAITQTSPKQRTNELHLGQIVSELKLIEICKSSHQI